MHLQTRLDLPGGMAEANETPDDAARREGIQPAADMSAAPPGHPALYVKQAL